MDKKQNDRQQWLIDALQGLAFWMGYRQKLFNGYPLSEAAIVSELCHLIQTNKPDCLKLQPERMYKDLVSLESGKKKPNDTWGQTRADLVLCGKESKAKGRKDNISDSVRLVIEVKRGSASKQDIEEDLRRLHKFLKAHHSGARAFLFVLSEGRVPNGEFVKDGKAWRGKPPITGCDGGFYQVRRVLKATLSFKGKENAHYACLAEVALKGQRLKDI